MHTRRQEGRSRKEVAPQPATSTEASSQSHSLHTNAPGVNRQARHATADAPRFPIRTRPRARINWGAALLFSVIVWAGIYLAIHIVVAILRGVL